MAKNWNCTDCGILIWNRYKHCKSCSHKGQRNIHFGGRAQISGKDNPNWRGGISKDKYTYYFKKTLSKLVRSIIPKCQECYIKTDLVAHHIDYDKLNNTTQNLITLCRSCNAKVNFNRELHKTNLAYKREHNFLII